MPQTYTFKREQITVHVSGPEPSPAGDVFFFYLIINNPKTEARYKRDPLGWYFQDEGNWFKIDPQHVPQHVKIARIKYGSGDWK